MIEQHALAILQALIVAALIGTAKILWATSIKLATIDEKVQDHGKRIDRLEGNDAALARRP